MQKLFTIYLLYFIFIIPAAFSQQRIIKGGCYIENHPDSYVFVQFGKQSTINTENRFLFTDSLSDDEILFSLIGTISLKITNLSSKTGDIDLGRVELIPFSDKRISKEEYNRKRNNLLKRKKDTSFVDDLLKSRYRYIVSVRTYPAYRREYLDSLFEKERTELMKKKQRQDSRPPITEYYLSNNPSKNKMSIYVNEKRVAIPVKKYIKKNTIYLNYQKVYDS